MTKPFIMRNRLSSIAKYVIGSESCAICAIAVTIIAAVVLWQVMVVLQGQMQDYVALQRVSQWRP